jgi:hypothetical protein
MKQTFINPDAIDAAEVYYDDDGNFLSMCVHLQPGADGEPRKFTSKEGQEIDPAVLQRLVALRGDETKEEQNESN